MDEEQFNPQGEYIDMDETEYFCGQRRSGKSVACTFMDVLRRRWYPLVFVFTNTKSNNWWQQWVVERNIINGLDEGLLEAIIELAKKRYQLYKKTKATQGSADGNPYIRIIMDDVVSDKHIRSSKPLRSLLFEGRHMGISLAILSQDWVGINRDMRNNCDRVYFWRTTDEATRKHIRAQWGGEVLAKVDEFTDTRYQCAVINNKANIQGCVVEPFLANYDELMKMRSRNLHLGNARTWGKTRIEDQKKEYPYIDMPSRQTLVSRFNGRIGVAAEDEAIQTVDLAELGGEEHELKGADNSNEPDKPLEL